MSKRFNNFKSGGRCKLSGDCWLLQRLTERQELNLGLNDIIDIGLIRKISELINVPIPTK